MGTAGLSRFDLDQVDCICRRSATRIVIAAVIFSPTRAHGPADEGPYEAPQYPRTAAGRYRHRCQRLPLGAELSGAGSCRVHRSVQDRIHSSREAI